MAVAGAAAGAVTGDRDVEQEAAGGASPFERPVGDGGEVVVDAGAVAQDPTGGRGWCRRGSAPSAAGRASAAPVHASVLGRGVVVAVLCTGG